MFYLGIDGGGSKTEAVLCDYSGKILSRFLAEGSNPNDGGYKKSFNLLRYITEKAAKGIAFSEISAFYGIAGCHNTSNSSEIYNLLEKEFTFSSLCVGADITNIFSSELSLDDMCMLICGTGSVAFSRINGVLLRTGGWGYLIDDAGSGYDIGRSALRAVYREYDSRGEHTVLSELISEKLGNDLESAIPELYRKGKKEIASYAPLVFDGFYKSDKICENILLSAADELAALIRASAMKISAEKVKVLLYGGVVSSNEIIVRMIKERLPYNYELIRSCTAPVFGACVEAMRQDGIEVDMSKKNNFMKCYEEYNK